MVRQKDDMEKKNERKEKKKRTKIEWGNEDISELQ